MSANIINNQLIDGQFRIFKKRSHDFRIRKVFLSTLNRNNFFFQKSLLYFIEFHVRFEPL